MTGVTESVGLLEDSGSAPAGTAGLKLRLEVADPEVVTELEKHEEGPAREKYALGALRLGVMALRQARGELDSAAVRQAGQEILGELGELLAKRGTQITSDIAGALRQYFDPSTGTLRRA
jgi:hypothetical protein